MTNIISLTDYKAKVQEKLETEDLADAVFVANNITNAVTNALRECGVYTKDYQEDLAEIYACLLGIVEESGITEVANDE